MIIRSGRAGSGLFFNDRQKIRKLAEASQLRNIMIYNTETVSRMDKRYSGFIRSELAHRVNLRNTPQLRFIMDDSIAYGVEMSRRIDEVRAADILAEENRESAEEVSEPDEGTDPV